MEDARIEVARYVDHYNIERLHSALGYIAPLDKLNGREQEILMRRNVNWLRLGNTGNGSMKSNYPSEFLKPGGWNPVDATLKIEEVVVVG